MKKFVLLMLPLFLFGACEDKSIISQVNLFCGDAYQNQPTYVDVKFLGDKAIMKLDDREIALQKTGDYIPNENAIAFISYVGKMDSFGTKAYLNVIVNPKRQAAYQYTLGFTQDQVWSCMVEIPYKIAVKPTSENSATTNE